MSDTTPRDQLAQIIEGISSDEWRGDWISAADAIIAAGWRPPARVVTTEEEAEALHDGTLIVDRQGDSGQVWQGAVNYSETAVLPMDSALKRYGPFKVYYEPEEGE